MSGCLCLRFNRFIDLSGGVHSQPLPSTAIFHFVIFLLQRKELKITSPAGVPTVQCKPHYLQGHNGSGQLAKIVMQHWAKKYREIFDMTVLMVTQLK